MSPALHHENTRVPVTALASCGAVLIAAEGPFLRFYHAKTSRYITSRRVFKAQAVHGISVYAEESEDVTKFVIWGGRLVRALQINVLKERHALESLSLNLSNVVKAPDWILDLAPQLSSLEDDSKRICAAVTAHNALLELTIRHHIETPSAPSSFNISIFELTASTRSILYSAHLLWESYNCILVAAGTAFGEIMYWSWNKKSHSEAISQIHQVFLGHEGSIFDVRISRELQRGCCGPLKRVIASCSDDRTIRLWGVSNLDVHTSDGQAVDQGDEAQRTRHTGFSVAATEVQSDSSNCLAIGWGHTSRVWKVRFTDSSPCDETLTVLSAGEDATSRTWKLVASTSKRDALPNTLQQIDCAAYHNGKNMWSIVTYRPPAGPLRVACGAADGKITTHPLFDADQQAQYSGLTVANYTVQDLLHMAQPLMAINEAQRLTNISKRADSIRSYCFILYKTFLLVTDSGKILIESFDSKTSASLQSNLTSSILIDQLEDLAGYSTCISVPTYGVAFLAGAKGNIYMYSTNELALTSIHSVTGKVGSLFATETVSAGGRKRVMLLITLMGQKQAQLLSIDLQTNQLPFSLHVVSVPLSDILTGPTVTSMSITETDSENTVLFLGFRRGSIGLYNISQDAASAVARLFRVIEKVHGDETVTSMRFEAFHDSISAGHLFSVGRDGRLAVHMIDLIKNSVILVHNLTLPIGPNIEDLYLQEGHLLVHGFSSKKWVLYDVASEEEVMSIETGGAHRSWAFQSSSCSNNPRGGTLVWTRAASLHICSQEGSNHDVLRSGGHGREIKAVAVSSRGLIATGAEDTDIKIFQYVEGELVCRRTLRRHTTGIQHLQWSEDGDYLFSSAGSEEFYIWRIRALDTVIDIGVVCESSYTPESEFSDLRIMSFDVSRSGSAYTIAMVFSDSSIKTYHYDPLTALKWQPFAKGIYFTSCLTQCILLSPTRALTAGTDGHAVLWPLPSGLAQPKSTVLKWHNPARIHQNASKTMASHANKDGTTLIVSGGDDGALAFLLAHPVAKETSSSSQEPYASPPVLVNRAHASAITACALVPIHNCVYVLTSGNDEWVRLWEVKVDTTNSSEASNDMITIKRLSKVKTSVADVSSMAMLGNAVEAVSRVLVCGVGMEIIRLDLS